MEVEVNRADYYARIEFPMLVRHAMEEKDITQGDLACELGIARTSLIDRLQGNARFTAAEAMYLSQRFNIVIPNFGA